MGNEGGWSAAFDVRPTVAFGAVVVAVMLAWIVFVTLDIVEGGDVAAHGFIFNDGPVEWAQWTVLLTCAILAAFVSGRCPPEASRFWTLMAVGFGVMVLEDAGDIRHALAIFAYGSGRMVAGHVINAAFLAAVAALPSYAVLRHGRAVWHPGMRGWLVGGCALYGMAGGGSAANSVGDLYIRVGHAVDRWLLGGRFPTPDSDPWGLGVEDFGAFILTDGPIEESIELLAAGCLLALVLAQGRRLTQPDPADAPYATATSGSP